MNREASGMHAERAEANASVDTIESILAGNRAALDRTLSELEQRISMQGFFREVRDRLGNESGAEFLRNLRDSVVHNPVPITLAAIGLAWTAFSEGNGREGNGRASSAGLRLGDVQQKTAGAVNRARDAVTDTREGAAQRLGAVKARGRDWAGRGGQAVGNARERASELGYNAAERTRRSMEQSRDLARDYPILTAGVGLALGAALAALVPATQAEREKLGPAGDRAMEQARRTAAAAGKAAMESAKEEVFGGSGGPDGDRQRPAEAGLSGPGGDGSGGGSPHLRNL